MSQGMSKALFGRGGVIPSERKRDIGLYSGESVKYLPDVDWSRAVLPSDTQHEGSCVCRATAGIIEALLRLNQGPDAILEGYQIDAERMYWTARKEFYGKDWQSDDGLELYMGPAIARVTCGPPDLQYAEVGNTPDAINAAMRTAPLLAATAVDDGWWNLTQHSWIPHIDSQYIVGGHAWCMAGVRCRAFAFYDVQNSWGTEWGGGTGRAYITHDNYIDSNRYINAGPFLLTSQQWSTWQGYKSWLVKP